MADENELYPSNSRFKKMEASQPKESRVPQEKVVSGVVKKQKKSLGKKLAETFLEDDTKTVGAYIVQDVLIPAGKSLICDVVGWGGFAEMLLFGGVGNRRSPGSGSSIRRDGGRTVVNYGAMSRTSYGDARDGARRDIRRDISPANRARHNFEEIVLDSRGEAEEVLERLVDLTIDYQIASVADLYEMVGIESNHTDTKYGWVDLKTANVQRIRGGYLINLPRPQPLD